MEMFLLIAVAGCFLLQPQMAAEGVRTGLQVCAGAILPSLFPLFVLTDYWISRGHADRLAQAAGPLMEKLFHLPGSSASAFLLGSIGGYPVGARTVAELYAKELLTKKQAEQALFFCNNAGPAFVLGVLGGGLFQSTLAGVVLYWIHILSSVLIGILFRPKDAVHSMDLSINATVPPIAQSWTNAISNGGKTALQVCIYVLFFAILNGCIQTLLHNPLITGILELAGGAKALGESNLSARAQFIASAFLLGWGGLCVMMQSLSLLHTAGLSGKKLLIGKTLQGGSSLLLATAIAPVLPLKQNCFSVPMTVFIWPQYILVLLFLIFGIFLKESTGKLENNRI